ncbi:hypothetical protein A1O1_03179 [Capronia coronata CBS 617.96]|uniref:Zn(2)-C6 fungal-type domain-containing protein n=1 Tax=Capronia coronata CBS 617.96 TaxID=1182541 RepID=W9YZP8_9EURO|nr:uncharacterized protein A1O1_03179 [Capronia coronata CBS 617.96]EXJ94781.1 hypothetical protein A1O1_03179 [Capronia coronata CBS 617.96]
MPPSLRKACHACTASKRRCRPQLPKCSRCLERGLDCTYDLEPVSNLTTTGTDHILPAQHPVRQVLPTRLYDSVAAAHADAIRSYTPQGYDLQKGVQVMANPETFELTKLHLRRIPLLTFQHRSTLYVHAQVLSAGEGLSAIPLVAARSDPPSRADSTSGIVPTEKRRLLSLNVRDLTFTQFMAVFHELIAIVLASYLDKSQTDVVASDFQNLSELFTTWAQHFYSILPESLDSSLSAWQAWVIAESGRRTMICIDMIRGVMEILRLGYCYYRPGIEALPFDARTGLWEANSEEEWRSALASHGGEECSLMSWHEFIESGGPAPRKEHDGMLQRLLLVGYFGKVAAQYQMNADDQFQNHGTPST